MVAFFCPLHFKGSKYFNIWGNSSTCTRQMHNATALGYSRRKPQVNPEFEYVNSTG